jgi:hypothetical protein
MPPPHQHGNGCQADTGDRRGSESARLPNGCPFHPRCLQGDGGRCTTDPPLLLPAAATPGSRAACHYAVMLTEWYGGQTRKLEYVSSTAVWYHNGMPPAAIRWVLVRDPSGQRDAQAFLGTDIDLEPTAILQRFVSRWRIETTFQEAREHLGVETQRQSTSGRSHRRTATSKGSSR